MAKQLNGLAAGVPDTRPITLGGVSGTGTSRSFFVGGFSGAGAVGAMPWGTPPAPLLPTGPMPASMGRSLLGMPPTEGSLGAAAGSGTQDEPSPKSADGLEPTVVKVAVEAVEQRQ